MTSPINSKISEWQHILRTYELEPISPELTTKVRDLYEDCRKVETTNKELLESDVSLKQEFNQLETRVHSLFLRSIRQEIQQDAGSSLLQEFDTYAPEYKNVLLSLAESLYKGDDTNTVELIGKLPQDMQHVLFKNLWRVLGKPESPYGLGEFAFLNANNYSATTKDKYDAVISSLTEKDITRAFAASGDLNSLKNQFSEGRERLLDQYGFCEDVLAATKNGHIEALRFLLSEGRESLLDQLGLRDAVEAAAEYAHIEILRFLLSEGRESLLRQFTLNEAVTAAAKNGHTEILRFLLSEGRERQLDAYGLNEAVYSAAKNGHREILGILLSEGRERQLGQYRGLNAAVKAAAKNDHIEALRFLLSEGRERQLDQNGLNEAVYSAAENGHREILHFLLSERRESLLDQNGLNYSVYLAAKNGHIEILRFLLSEGRERQLDEYGLTDAVKAAAENDQIEALRFLLSEGRQIPGYTRDDAVLQASSQGYFTVVEFLLSTGPISASARDSSITQASGLRSNEIRDILRMAQIRPEITLRQDTATIPGVMDISLEFIKQDPLAVLAALSPHTLPNSFSLQNSPQTIDLGGVSKQVYYTLFSSLIESNRLSLTEGGIPRVEQENALQIYHTLGTFYSRFAIRNKDRNDPFLTGHVFSPSFFSMMKIILDTPDDDSALLTFLKSVDKNLEACFSLLQDNTSLELKAKVKSIMAFYEEEGDELEFAKKAFNSYKNPIVSFIDGAEASGVSEEFFNNIRRLSAEGIAEWLQGKSVNKELVLSSLQVAHDRNIHFVHHVDWIKEKIASSDKEWLEKFVFAITGRKALAFNTTIKLKPTWRQGAVFEFHTCFNSLDLPGIELSKVDFLAALKLALDNFGYNIA